MSTVPSHVVNVDEVTESGSEFKVMVRNLRAVGFLEKTPYLQGEPETQKIFELARALVSGTNAVTNSGEREP